MASLVATDAQQELAHSVAKFLKAELPVERLTGAGLDPALDSRTWHQMASLGWLGIATAGVAGGSDLPVGDHVLVAREFGRVLAPLSMLTSLLGARVAQAAGNAPLAESIIAGISRVAIGVPTRAPGEGAGAYLLDCHDAALALLVRPDGATLHGLAELAELEQRDAFDEAMPLAWANLAAAPVLCQVPEPGLYDLTLILSAAYATGMCEAITGMAVRYASTREQFDRPIGGFQAVKHRCADMAIRSDAAWAQVVFAALCFGQDNGRARYQALAARLVASAHAIVNAQANIQLHGAIGVTDELVAHRFLKRARVMDMCFGTAVTHRDALLSCSDVLEQAA